MRLEEGYTWFRCSYLNINSWQKILKVLVDVLSIFRCKEVFLTGSFNLRIICDNGEISKYLDGESKNFWYKKHVDFSRANPRSHSTMTIFVCVIENHIILQALSFKNISKRDPLKFCKTFSQVRNPILVVLKFLLLSFPDLTYLEYRQKSKKWPKFRPPPKIFRYIQN